MMLFHILIFLSWCPPKCISNQEKGSAWVGFLRQKDILCWMEMDFYDWSKYKSDWFLIHTHPVISSVWRTKSQRQSGSSVLVNAQPFFSITEILQYWITNGKSISLHLTDVSQLLLCPEHVWFNLDRHKSHLIKVFQNTDQKHLYD